MAKQFTIRLLFILGLTAAQAQERAVDLEEVHAVLVAWTEAHNEKDLAALDKLYADEVIFYTKRLRKEKCLAIKSKRLQSPMFFYNQMITKPAVEVFDKEIIKVSFVRQVISGTDVTDYEAYLLLKENGGALGIIGESHLKADRKVGFVPDIGEEMERVTGSQNSLKVVGGASEPGSEITDGIASTDIKWGWAGLFQVIMMAVVVALFWSIRKSRRRRLSWKVFTLPAESQEKGLTFEKFVVNRFDRNFFKLLDWRSDKIVDGVYAQSTFYPDLHYQFKCRDQIKEFAVECKYRSRLVNGQFELGERQLENYRRYGREMGIPVFIALGTGGEPSAPKALFMIPLSLFTNNPRLGYEDLRTCYRSPRFNFFLNPNVDETLWFKKPEDYSGAIL